MVFSKKGERRLSIQASAIPSASRGPGPFSMPRPTPPLSAQMHRQLACTDGITGHTFLENHFDDPLPFTNLILFLPSS